MDSERMLACIYTKYHQANAKNQSHVWYNGLTSPVRFSGDYMVGVIENIIALANIYPWCDHDWSLFNRRVTSKAYLEWIRTCAGASVKVLVFCD